MEFQGHKRGLYDLLSVKYINVGKAERLMVQFFLNFKPIIYNTLVFFCSYWREKKTYFGNLGRVFIYLNFSFAYDGLCKHQHGKS